MAYNKKTWISNEIITSAALNNMEEGIANLDNNKADKSEVEIDYDNILSFNTKEICYIPPLDIIGFVDDNNNIVINKSLSAGTYTINYETNEGDRILVDTFNHAGALNLLETAEVKLNQRFSKGSNAMMTQNSCVSIVTPITTDGNTEYILTMGNLVDPFTDAPANSVACSLDENRSYLRGINNATNFGEMTTGIEFSDNNTTATVRFTPEADVKYIAISIFFGFRDNNGYTIPLTQSDIEDLIVTLE